MRRKMRTIPTRIDQVQDPDQREERRPRRRADQPGRPVQRRAVVLDRAAQRRGRRHDEDRRARTRSSSARARRRTRRSAGAARRSSASGRVVDRADVVGVEGVPHAERVRGDADAERRTRRRAEAVVVRQHERDSRKKPTACRPAIAATSSPARRHSAGVNAPETRRQRDAPGADVGDTVIVDSSPFRGHGSPLPGSVSLDIRPARANGSTACRSADSLTTKRGAVNPPFGIPAGGCRSR